MTRRGEVASSPLARAVAAGRELAALVNGPFRLRWYWRDELEQMQSASRRYADAHPAARLRRYRPTDEQCPQPIEPDVTGRAWRYAAPATTSKEENR